MEKVKVVKGTPMYKYKGRYVLDVPKNTYVKCMYYNEEKNITEIILRKVRYKIEVMCSVLLVCMVLLKVYNIRFTCNVNYDSNPLYCNGILYLNIVNKNNSSYPVNVYLEDAVSGTVIAKKGVGVGEEWLTLSIPECKPEYVLRLYSKNIVGKEVETIVKLNVRDYTKEEDDLLENLSY